MKLKLRAFPVVYFTARCAKHDCWVAVRPQGSTETTGTHIVASQLIAYQCKVGGEASKSKCEDTWELTISGPGPITIE